jgi:hypothetical protein
MDTVLTWLLNSTIDPQRHAHMPADPDLLTVLRESVNKHGHTLTVLTDCLDLPDDDGTEYVKVPPGGNPYFYRWTCVADYLDAHPEVTRVWCVDGTDTEMLHDPFPHMRPGRWYVGSEPAHFDNPQVGPWLTGSCPSAAEFINANPLHTVLNMGILGGDPTRVRDIARTLGSREGSGDQWEMGTFQVLAYVDNPDFITGPMVHSLFKAEQRDSLAWWRHK